MFTKDDRVKWLHFTDLYRHGTVEDIDGTIGVRTDDHGDLIYLPERQLEPEL